MRRAKIKGRSFWAAAAILGSAVVFAAPNAPLVDALKSGDKATVLALLDARADVNTPEPDGTTALAWAARMDDLDPRSL